MGVIINKTSAVIVAVVMLAGVPLVMAADPENCASCHRYRGLARMDEQNQLQLYHVDPGYYDHGLGPHARLRCTECHPRDEVGVIPHKPVSRVNCTTACHLSSAASVETQFSHDTVAGMLERSAHTAQVLDRCNELLGKPLGEGQSRCLLCHDQPAFRRGQERFERQSPVDRCNVCHGDQLPVPMGPQFMYWHVHARSNPARSNEELVSVCALCHSDRNVREAFNLPDTTASYLASFHGKAMLLGSEETAGCLDCHVGEMQNVHVMLSQKNPQSSTHPEKLPDTCRSPACHPTAGHKVTTAAVHLDISTTRGIEYFIAAMFILLIMFTFGPSVVLQSLEMLQIVLGRHDPRQHQRHEMASRLQQNPVARAQLVRFTPHQRVQHWILAISFTLLVLTGFPIKFADRDWARWLVDLFGGVSNARMVHRWAGVVLMVGFFYHFLYIGYTAILSRRRTKASWLRTILDLPMLTNPKDIRQLFQQLGFLLFLRKERPELGRFSLKEKFEYFGVFWGSFLLGITGMLMWFNDWTTTYLTGRVLTISLLVHTFEAFLALLHVGILHMIGVIFSPAVFPISPAMFSGDTPAEELAEAHAGLVDDVAAKAGMRTEASHG